MTPILTHTEITHKIRRIAYQIYEANSNENEIILAGIEGNGYLLTEKIAVILSEICPIKITICKVNINKKNPIGSVVTSLKSTDYENKSIILVDDVLNSGKTLIYGVKHFLEVEVKRIKTVVLVNRNHKKFPIKADFKGISLSTSLHEHIEVSFSEGNFAAYLI